MKKILSVALVVVLLAGIAVTGTMAYLQDTDSDVNVMTLGNVDIEQIEQEWNADKTELQPFTQAKPLYPYVGELGWENEDEDEDGGAYRRFTMNNVVDKYVSVKNTGRSDAYVRTLIALEMGEFTYDEFNLVGISINAENGSEFKFPDTWEWGSGFVAQIDGNNYYVMVAVHKNPVQPGETTIPSLLQVYLSKDATNDDVAKLDGNGNGTYDILVLSQAVQTNGFDNAQTALDTAFGVANAANAAEWFVGEDGTVEIPKPMSSYEDIKAAMDMGEDGNYVIADDFTADDRMYSNGTNSTIDLNGKTITANNKGQYLLAAPSNSTLHLTGEGTVDMGKGFFASGDNAGIIIDGGTYNATNTGTLNSIKHCSLAQKGGQIVINGGTFTTDVADAVLFFATSNARIEINGGFFENTVDDTPDLLGIGTNNNNTNRIIITGGTFVNYNPLNDRMCYTGAWPAAGEAAFGGPWILIPGGYKVVSETQTNGDVWYSVVPA